MTLPILLDIPYSFDTDRMIKCGPLPGDGKSVHQAVVESEHELRPWMPWAVKIEEEQAYETRVRQMRLQFLARDYMQMYLFLKKDETFIGAGSLHNINWDVPKFEVGYWVRTSCAGQGYVTEFVNGVTDFAFNELGAKRVEIRCDKLNARSTAVARRAGYELEATIRHDDRHHLTGALRDTLIFCKLQT